MCRGQQEVQILGLKPPHLRWSLRRLLTEIRLRDEIFHEKGKSADPDESGFEAKSMPAGAAGCGACRRE
jgi:hypothetical protein